MPSTIGARRLGPHEIGARGAAAQRVIDEAGDRCAVAGAGEAMRQTPVFQRIGRGPASRFDIAEDLDGGGKPRGRRHGRPGEDAHDEDDPHERQHHRADADRRRRAADVVVGHMHAGLQHTHRTKIQASTTISKSAWCVMSDRMVST